MSLFEFDKFNLGINLWPASCVLVEETEPPFKEKRCQLISRKIDHKDAGYSNIQATGSLYMVGSSLAAANISP